MVSFVIFQEWDKDTPLFVRGKEEKRWKRGEVLQAHDSEERRGIIRPGQTSLSVALTHHRDFLIDTHCTKREGEGKSLKESNGCSPEKCGFEALPLFITLF